MTVSSHASYLPMFSGVSSRCVHDSRDEIVTQ